jgi:hypothetical protein
VEEVTDEPLYRDRVCGIDIGKAQMVATIRVPSDKDPARRMTETRSFGTTRKEVLALADGDLAILKGVPNRYTGDLVKRRACRTAFAESNTRRADSPGYMGARASHAAAAAPPSGEASSTPAARSRSGSAVLHARDTRGRGFGLSDRPGAVTGMRRRLSRRCLSRCPIG